MPGVDVAQAMDMTLEASQRERELGAIILAYNEVTDRLKSAHERLGAEVARLREELRRTNEELRRRERLAALGEMAAGLAHEVRNPLGGIALYASMLERELPGDSAVGRAARRISQGVRGLEQLIREILDFAQEDRLDVRRCPLRTVLEGLEETLRPWKTECQGSVTIQPSALEIELRCDPSRLQRALLNLLINGLQAAGAGGEVELSARTAPHGGGVEIEIVDDGPGIRPADLPRIFNPFFTTRASGTGLGLAICHRIVEAHGGTIRASNRREGGARFVVWLPAGGDALSGEETGARTG